MSTQQDGHDQPEPSPAAGDKPQEDNQMGAVLLTNVILPTAIFLAAVVIFVLLRVSGCVG